MGMNVAPPCCEMEAHGAVMKEGHDRIMFQRTVSSCVWWTHRNLKGQYSSPAFSLRTLEAETEGSL